MLVFSIFVLIASSIKFKMNNHPIRNSLKTLLFLVIALTACKQKQTTKDFHKAKGSVAYGGTLRISEVEPRQTLFPISIADNISAEVANQLYEGLLKLNPKDLSIIPGLATRWTIDSTRTKYTFYLKKGVFFHDNDCFSNSHGREVKAPDFKYSFELICTQRPDNNAFSQIFKDILKGANKYYDASSKGKPDFDVEGIKVIDDYTLELILEKPRYTFLYSLALPATVVVPFEALEKYGTQASVGTGPFIFVQESEPDMDKTTLLIRNEKYHGEDELGNRLPYLDSVIIRTYNSEQLAFEAFKNNEVDLVYKLPALSVKKIVQENIANFQSTKPKFILELNPQMSTQFYEFVTQEGKFKDKRIRQAISYAIDRNNLVDNVLNGEAFMPGIYGISPPVFKGYNNNSIKGYNYDVKKAKALMAEAGFPDGKGFPKITIELNSGGSRHIKVALEVQKQLRENLNINMDLLVVPFAQKLRDAKYGKGDFFRSSWIADYPNPATFLQVLYGKTVPSNIHDASVPNTSRYISFEFDRLYEKGLAAASAEESFKYFLEAEQIAMNDAPVMVLWYDSNYRLLHSRVHGLFNNSVQYRDFSKTYIVNENVK
jgi:oligopeptide transport system substrate-binding protein